MKGDRGCEPNLSAFSIRWDMPGSMSDPKSQAELFPIPNDPEGVQIINERCLVRTQEGRRMVIVAGIVLAHYAVDDRIAEAHARVNLVEQGWADQNDVARVFDCSARTVRRDQQRFEDGGMAALGHAGGYPAGRARVTLTQSVATQGRGSFQPRDRAATRPQRDRRAQATAAGGLEGSAH